MLIHSLFYVPTISVANSLAFANLKDPQKEFGLVRMGGTIGWILAAWPFYFVLKGAAGRRPAGRPRPTSSSSPAVGSLACWPASA